jgi:hypothetical protein
MKNYNFSGNPDNKFKVVRYFPTLEMIKQDLLNMKKNNWGYCDVLNRIIDEDFDGKDLGLLLKEDKNTINLLSLLTEKSFTDFNHHFGLQNIQTGEIINRFYKRIFYYHPEQGYVIFEQESERDFWSGGADPMFRLVSLKSGKEFDDYFVDKKFTSGIRDFKFISYDPNELAEFTINPITEELEINTFIPPNFENGLVAVQYEKVEEENCDLEDEELSNENRPTSHSKLAQFYYNIEWVDFGQPYFETELFDECLNSNPDLKRIFPFKS